MTLKDYEKKYRGKRTGWTLKRYQAYEKFCEENPKPLQFKKEYQNWYDRLAAYMEEKGFKDV